MFLRLLICIGLLIAATLVKAEWVLETPAVQETPTQEFENPFMSSDSCIAPCWKGLTPGKSTSQEVAYFLSQGRRSSEFCCLRVTRRSTFDPITGSMIKGRYSFYWSNRTRTNFTYVPTNQFRIEDHTLISIGLVINHVITLGQILDLIGQPEQISFYVALYGHPMLTLEYLDLDLSTRINFAGEAAGCTMSDIKDAWWMDSISFYTLASLKKTNEFNLLPIPEVPLDLWEDWLSGKVTSTCEEASHALYEAQLQPTASP